MTFFVLRSACTDFGITEDRRRLGITKNDFFVLRSACTDFGITEKQQSDTKNKKKTRKTRRTMASALIGFKNNQDNSNNLIYC